MKKIFVPLFLFISVFVLYFGIATGFSFQSKWYLDYFNPLGQSIRQGRLDIVNPAVTYDLVQYGGKWYAPWGILPALFLIPVQMLKGRFVPPLYLTLFFASADVVIFYFLLQRTKREFLLKLSEPFLWLVLILFAFGTTHLYVGTLGSVWHGDQMVSNFFGTLGIYSIFKKKRTLWSYFFSALCFGTALMGRATIVLLVSIQVLLYSWDFLLPATISWSQRVRAIRNGIVIFGIPLGIFTGLFFLYNWLRFGNSLEYGYRYITEAPNLASLRERYGIMSLSHVATNIRYMFFELPGFYWSNGLRLNFDLKGNSIFFLTPPFLAIFFAKLDRYVLSLWIAAIITMIPSLLIYSTGWMQFGYRYSLDVTAVLVLLSLFGMKGKLNVLYVIGVAFSVVVYQMGITALR
ncbi:MAG: hypothetical protein AAB457_03740 [Patescibacteria group bacterium]